eukprot:6659820-Pyramimonas_sp.AAC.1
MPLSWSLPGAPVEAPRRSIRNNCLGCSTRGWLARCLPPPKACVGPRKPPSNPLEANSVSWGFATTFLARPLDPTWAIMLPYWTMLGYRGGEWGHLWASPECSHGRAGDAIETCLLMAPPHG